jgi:hypothetical protein
MISWFPWFLVISRDLKWFEPDEISLFPLDNDKVHGVETSRIYNRIDQQENESFTNKLKLFLLATKLSLTTWTF